MGKWMRRKWEKEAQRKAKWEWFSTKRKLDCIAHEHTHIHIYRGMCVCVCAQIVHIDKRQDIFQTYHPAFCQYTLVWHRKFPAHNSSFTLFFFEWIDKNTQRASESDRERKEERRNVWVSPRAALKVFVFIQGWSLITNANILYK